MNTLLSLGEKEALSGVETSSVVSHQYTNNSARTADSPPDVHEAAVPPCYLENSVQSQQVHGRPACFEDKQVRGNEQR